MVFQHGKGNGRGFAKNGDFKETGVDRVGQIGYLFELNSDISSPNMLALGDVTHQVISLPDFIWRLLQPSLRCIYSSITLVDIFLHVAHVIILEAILALVCRSFVLGFERFAVDLGAGTEILLGVCEKVMGTCSYEIRAADFRVGDRKLSVSRGGSGAHELLCGYVSAESS